MASSVSQSGVGETPADQQKEQERIESLICEEEDRYLATLANAGGLVGTKGIEPEDGFNYCVLLYFLFPQADGDGNVGMWNLLRSFSSKEKACAYAEEIIAKYAVRQVLVTKTCQWNVLSRKATAPKQLVSIKTGKVISLDNMLQEQQQHRVEQAKDQIDQDRILRQLGTSDPTKMNEEERRAYASQLKQRQEALIREVRAIQNQLSQLN